MRNIFLLIRRYFNLLLFLFLQIVCITFIVQYSKYHHSMFGETMNGITGSINKRYDNVNTYFSLRKTNDSLVKANERLYSMLKRNYNFPDSADRSVVDSIMIDSVLQYRKFSYKSAKVVSSSVSGTANFLVLYGDNIPSFTASMGVVGPNSEVLGRVTEVSGKYAVVMSLLHKDSRLSGKLLNMGESGDVYWDGKEPNLLKLSRISKSVRIKKGDSVVTSGLSAIFPKGLLIGTIVDFKPETTTNNYNITIRTAANFNTVEYAYGIESADAAAVKQLTDKAKAASAQ